MTEHPSAEMLEQFIDCVERVPAEYFGCWKKEHPNYGTCYSSYYIVMEWLRTAKITRAHTRVLTEVWFAIGVVIGVIWGHFLWV